MPRPRRFAALLGCLWLPHCGPAPAAPPTPRGGAAERCLVASDSIAPAEHVTIVVDRADVAARARLASDREPPVRFDCEGRPLPALAQSWSHDSASRAWTLVLPAPAAGEPQRWTAYGLVAAWQADSGARAALRYAGVESLVALDERRVVFGFDRRQPTLPAVLADGALGVAATPSRARGVEIAVAPGDLRDAIDGGADLVQTDDPAVIDYAARRGGRTAVPLPWSGAVLLVIPPHRSPLDSATPGGVAALREGLARDAVHASARPAGAGWWDSVSACPMASGTAGRDARTSGALVYSYADRTAREIAERLVALENDPALRARGLDADAYDAALRAGSDRAYLVRVELHPTSPCREADRWPGASTVVGLVETREHALVRRGAPRLTVGQDGSLRLP